MTIVWGPAGSLDPEQAYREDAVTKPEGDTVDALIAADVAVTAGHCLRSAAFLSSGTQALGRSLANPYSLLRVSDAQTVAAELGGQLLGAAAVAEGLATWLTAAHARGEVSIPVATVDALNALAQQIRVVADQVDAVELPEDTSAPLTAGGLAEQVTDRLRERGVAVDEPEVTDTGISWDLPDDQALLVTQQGWEWLIPSGEPGNYTVALSPTLPYQPYVHPDYVAQLVADHLADDQQAG